jgi:hypothetical protein
MSLLLLERRFVKEEGEEEEVINWVEKEKFDGEFIEFDMLAEAEDAMKFESLREVNEFCKGIYKGLDANVFREV